MIAFGVRGVPLVRRELPLSWRLLRVGSFSFDYDFWLWRVCELDGFAIACLHTALSLSAPLP